MHAEFEDIHRAASYLAEGLYQDFPDAIVEIVVCDPAHGRYRSTVCSTRNLSAELYKLCQTFPGAAVDYTPKRPYGIVGFVNSTEHQFHVTPHAGRQHMRRHLRPVVTSKSDGRCVWVFLREVNHHEVLLGSRNVLPHERHTTIEAGALRPRFAEIEEAPI